MTEWIEYIKDKPIREGIYLFFTDPKRIMIGCSNKDGDIYLDDEVWQCLNNVKITHWAELPAPPAEP